MCGGDGCVDDSSVEEVHGDRKGEIDREGNVGVQGRDRLGSKNTGKEAAVRNEGVDSRRSPRMLGNDDLPSLDTKTLTGEQGLYCRQLVSPVSSTEYEKTTYDGTSEEASRNSDGNRRTKLTCH